MEKNIPCRGAIQLNILKDYHEIGMYIKKWSKYPNEYPIYQEVKLEYLKEYSKLE